MKKKYYFISTMIIIISFSMITLLTKIINKKENDKDISYGDITKEIEQIDYYLYEDCNGEKLKDHIKINYFLINDYFLNDEELFEFTKYLNDKKDIVYKNDEYKDDTCNNKNLKKIDVEMNDGTHLIITNNCSKEKEEIVDYLDSKLNELLNKQIAIRKEQEENSKIKSINAYEIQNVEYQMIYGWYNQNEFNGFSVLLDSTHAYLENDSPYYSLFKQEYAIDHNKWNNLTSYIQKNISKLDLSNPYTCADCNEGDLIIKLNNGKTYTIKTYGNIDDNFNEIVKQIYNTVGEEIIDNYVSDAKNYSIGKEAIKNDILDITVIEEPGIIENGFIVKNGTLTFFYKKYDGEKVVNNITKDFPLDNNKWNLIVQKVNDSFIKENEGSSVSINVLRSNGVTYKSELYPKLFDSRLYNDIVKIIGEKEFSSYEKEFNKGIK